MKIALIGSSGYIAGYITQRLLKTPQVKSILKVDRNPEADICLDLAKAEEMDESMLEDVDYVIFTAGVSGPDACARNFDECWKINVDGTGLFIQKAMEQGCRVLFFSSDAVFGNHPEVFFDENCFTQATTPYGRMKKAVEDRFKDEENFKAIRLSYVASAKDRFYSYCLNCMRQGKTAEVFHPFYRNVITVSDVVDVVIYFLFHWDEFSHPFLNVAGRELVSRVRMADEFNRVFGGKLKYTISMPGDEFFANRPQITQMKSIYLHQYSILPDNTFTEKIMKELEEIA